MEEKDEIQENPPAAQQSKAEEENSNICDEPTQESKQNQQSEGTKEDITQAVPSPNEDSVLDNEKENENGGGETGRKPGNKEAVSLQKAVPKQKSQKAKCTVPRPFSLATERRMSRERRGGAAAHPNPSLSKSASLNFKPERSSERKHGTAATVSNLKPSERAEKSAKKSGRKMKEKVEAKEDGDKKPPVAADHEVGGTGQRELEIKNLQKSSTFKASPLPNFYHKKATPPKPELKKIPSTRPKAPPLHRRCRSFSEPICKTEAINRNKSVSEVGNSKTQPLSRKSTSERGNGKTDATNRSNSISESGNRKIEPIIDRSKSILEPGNGETEAINTTCSSSKAATNNIATISETSKAKTVESSSKSTSRNISSTAKEAINKLLRGSWKTSTTIHNKESSAKSCKSCSVGGGLEKRPAATADEGKGVPVT